MGATMSIETREARIEATNARLVAEGQAYCDAIQEGVRQTRMRERAEAMLKRAKKIRQNKNKK